MSVGRVLQVGIGLAGSSALYYGLRALGLAVTPALIVVAVASAVPTVVSLLRGQRPQGVAALFTVLLLGGVLVSLVPGNARFLLAKESLLTGAAGVWFILSNRWGRRPLAYQFSKPVAEGRLSWPDHWEQLWTGSEAFRRMWRRASVMWGIGTLVDALLRVVMAYTLDPDVVPALSLGLFVATAVVLNVVTNVYYFRCGVFDRSGEFHRAGQRLHPSGSEA